MHVLTHKISALFLPLGMQLDLNGAICNYKSGLAQVVYGHDTPHSDVQGKGLAVPD